MRTCEDYFYFYVDSDGELIVVSAAEMQQRHREVRRRLYKRMKDTLHAKNRDAHKRRRR